MCVPVSACVCVRVNACMRAHARVCVCSCMHTCVRSCSRRPHGPPPAPSALGRAGSPRSAALRPPDPMMLARPFAAASAARRDVRSAATAQARRVPRLQPRVLRPHAHRRARAPRRPPRLRRRRARRRAAAARRAGARRRRASGARACACGRACARRFAHGCACARARVYACALCLVGAPVGSPRGRAAPCARRRTEGSAPRLSGRVGVRDGVAFEYRRAFASVPGRLPCPCGAGAKGFARQGCATGAGQCRGGPVPGRARAGAANVVVASHAAAAAAAAATALTRRTAGAFVRRSSGLRRRGCWSRMVWSGRWAAHR
jgi:hypothetical protein